MNRPDPPSTSDMRGIPASAVIRSTLTNIVVAVLFAVLMMSVPWESLTARGYFVDLRNYTEGFLYATSALEYRRFSSILDYATNEWLWHFSVSYLVNDLGVPIDVVFGAITFICLSVFSYFLSSRNGILSVPLLVNPLFVHLAFEQLRLALAFSLLLLAYLGGKKAVLALSVVVLGTIHTGVYLLAGIGLSIWFIKRFMLDRGKHLALVFASIFFVGMMVAVVTGTLGEIVLGYLGDRRATRYAVEGGGAGLKFTIFWLGVFVLAAFQGRAFFDRLENSYAVAILAFAVSSFVFGGYTNRMLAVSLPFLLSAIMSFRPPMNVLTIILYVVFVLVHWGFWFKWWA